MNSKTESIRDQSERVQNVTARIERIPFSRWHVNMRMIVGVATFFDALDAMMIAFILPVLIRAWHLRPDQIGLLISAGFVGQAAGAIFFGWLAERVGRVPSIIATVAVYAVMSTACGLSWDYGSLLIFRTIQGIGLGGEVPIAAAYINEFSKAKGRGRFVLLYEMVFLVGVVVASICSVIIVPRWGWRTMFYLGAIPAILALFLRWLVPESPRWLANRGRLDEAERIVAKIENIVSRNGEIVLPPVVPISVKLQERQTDWRELFSGTYLRRTLVVWVMYFATYFYVYGLNTWIPSLFVQVFKLPLQMSLRAGLYFSIAGLVTAFLTALLIDKVGRKRWFAMCFLVGGFIALILWLVGARTADTVLVLGLACNFFISSLTTALYLYVPELYPTRLRALGASVGTAWLRVASATAPIAVGFILARTSLNWVFLMFGLVGVLAGIVVLAFGIETKGKVLEEVSP